MDPTCIDDYETYAGDYETGTYAHASEQSHAGYFSESAATYWHEKTVDGANLNTRGQGLYRTAQDRWVLRRWSDRRGAIDVHYIEPDKAREWLVSNDYDDDAAELFAGPIEPVRPGRPEIGNPVQVRLGDLLPRVDAFAAETLRSRADVIRQLIREGLD